MTLPPVKHSMRREYRKRKGKLSTRWFRSSPPPLSLGSSATMRYKKTRRASAQLAISRAKINSIGKEILERICPLAIISLSLSKHTMHAPLRLTIHHYLDEWHYQPPAIHTYTHTWKRWGKMTLYRVETKKRTAARFAREPRRRQCAEEA